MSKYSGPEWADVKPIALDEGPGEGPALAAIAYPEAYSEAMCYLRAVMAANEMSDRALALTTDIIALNPAHYTVWLYRAKILFELKKDLDSEIEWLNKVALNNLKNYQIWHHRQLLIAKYPSVPKTERPFLATMLSLDTKNYHVWSYRQWLVSHFSLWDDPQELAYVEKLLKEDVRNNSAWNHRWFLCFGRLEREQDGMRVIDEDLIDREIQFAKEKIELAPMNESPWNYLRGLVRKGERKWGEEGPWVEKWTGDGKGEDVKSVFALEWVVGIAEEEGDVERAREILGWLAQKYDPIRRNYWNYRKGLLGAKG